MRQIDDAHTLVADLHGQPIELLMRKPQKLFEQAELDHQFER
jgi:hypothetical protein